MSTTKGHKERTPPTAAQLTVAHGASPIEKPTARWQRAAAEAQQARGQVSAEVGEVRAAEKARYDRRLAELETSIESRMSQLHAAARAHIEAEVTVRPQDPDS